MQKGKSYLIPLKQVSFTVGICQGFADVVMHQNYVNELDQPLEIQFMMPISEEFTCSKIALDFTLPDGSSESFETRVIEREVAEASYEDSVASGKTAVIATLPRITSQNRSNFMKVNLGNMPAGATANLRAFCNQKLEMEDQSYCFRLPFAYVPAYMGNAWKKSDSSDVERLIDTNDAGEIVNNEEIVQDVNEMPLKAQASGLWDIQVQVRGEGKLERVTSLNHPCTVLTTPSKTSALVSLKPSVDRSLVPTKDFVLYVRDSGISQPTAVSTITPSGQQAISLKMLTDTRSEHVKSRV